MNSSPLPMIPPRAFQLVARETLHSALSWTVNVTSADPDTLVVTGELHSVGPSLFGPTRRFEAVIPRDIRHMTVSVQGDRETAATLGQELLDSLKLCLTPTGVPLRARSLNWDAAQPGVTAYVSYDKTGRITPFIRYPSYSRLGRTSSQITPACESEAFLQGTGKVAVETVYNSFWQDVGDFLANYQNISWSSATIEVLDLIGVVFRYEVGDMKYAIAFDREDWLAMIWLLRRARTMDPCDIWLPEPEPERGVELRRDGKTLRFTVSGNELRICSLPAENTYFPLVFTMPAEDFFGLRTHPIMRPQCRRHIRAELPVAIYDLAGNLVINHPQPHLWLTRLAESSLISFGFPYYGPWPLGIETVDITPLDLKNIIKELQGETHRRTNELKALIPGV